MTHEATHIWQKCKVHLGESFPSPEFEAYSIQNITQSLIMAYEKLAGKKAEYADQ